MFVYHLLFAVRFHDNSKVVERLNGSANLKAVDEINRHGDPFLSNLIQKGVLHIDGLLTHDGILHSRLILQAYSCLWT